MENDETTPTIPGFYWVRLRKTNEIVVGRLMKMGGWSLHGVIGVFRADDIELLDPKPISRVGEDQHRIHDDGVDAGLAVLKTAVIDNDVNLRRLARKVVVAYLRNAAPMPSKDEIARALELAEEMTTFMKWDKATVVQKLVDIVLRQFVENQLKRYRHHQALSLRDALEHLAESNLTTPHDFKQFARKTLAELDAEEL